MKPSIAITFIFPEDTDPRKLSQFIKVTQMNASASKKQEINLETIKSPRYVYGLKGIQDLFGVCHSTAAKYKDGILKDACYQSGRKIVVDVDKALALFNGGRAAL